MGGDMSLKVAFGPHENPRIDALSDVQRLQWILEFTRRDLSALASDELKAIGDDLRHAAAPWWVHEAPYPCQNGNTPDMSAAQLCALQQEIRECIQSVMGEPIDIAKLGKIHRGHVPPEGWVLPEGPTRLVRLRFYPGMERIVRVSDSRNDRTAIMSGVASLLTAFTDRLVNCPVCGTPFVRQYRQEYCQIRCSNKVRNKRRLDRKAGRSADTASLTTA
jgi:hypothetical protein